MLNHFKTYFPCSNLKSAAVAKKTQGQLTARRRDDSERSACECLPSLGNHHQQSLVPNQQPVVLSISEFLFIWLRRKQNQFWIKHYL